VLPGPVVKPALLTKWVLATSRNQTVLGALRLLFLLSPLLAIGGPIGGPPQKEFKMISGTVKFFNADKGYGFIQPEDGSSDAFVHISAVEAAGMRTLDREQRVTYDLENDRRGRASAVNLQSA
jgi:CspA family cold shock protein